MEIKFIKGNKVALGAFRKTVRKLRVAAYCRVSTDSEDQIKSYNSMIKYYTDLIEKNDEWEFVGIYADKAITGTNVKKRNDFKRLIEDCTNGEIDMIITKSIPRFARNTLDTLKYVRMLKEMNVAVYFEVEKINTLKDGEFLTTILSSVAQQEVENTSAYVKKGLKMKMKRGEMVGSHRCFGYEVDKETRQLKIVEEEATAVRYIFNRYLEGAGGRVIANELNKKGIFTINNVEWSAPTVLGIIKNEKYKGDMLQGKTFTIDPISKRRLHNNGEEDKYYVIDHHEPIVSKEIFDKAQKLRKAKSTKKLANGTDQVVINRRYAFSSMLKCGYCGKNLVRKQWHSNSKYSKAVWYCSEPCRKGVKYCPNAKAISESVLEEAFVESYNRLCDNKQDVLEDLLAKIKTILKKEKIEESEQVKEALREEIEKILEKCDNSLKLETKPSVILVVGVNGVGKTTSIGKMAARLARDGKKVIVAAADTFRAAAVEQLEIWAQRAGAEVVKREEGVDPASVVFEAIRRTKESNADVLIIDTAGRLHNKKYLMDELNKIQKVVNKEMAEASKEVLLVIDATTGQNAISQVKAFKEQADITGIVLTKLDGTAKGGAVVGIVQENDIPVKFIGVGEQIDDMEIFNSKDFVKAII